MEGKREKRGWMEELRVGVKEVGWGRGEREVGDGGRGIGGKGREEKRRGQKKIGKGGGPEGR